MSGLTDSVTYDDGLLKPNMAVQAQQIALSLLPKKLYKKGIGRYIKAVGLRQNCARLIDKKYHKEMCTMPPLEVCIKVKNSYPTETKIEREFKNDGFVWEAVVTAFDLETKRYTLE